MISYAWWETIGQFVWLHPDRGKNTETKDTLGLVVALMAEKL